MNKILKKTIEYIPVAVVCTTVSVFAAIGYVDSKQVSYCPDTTNMEATTVSDAIDVLYENVDYTPVGTVSAYMGTVIPNKYLLCNGTVYNISDYPKLAEHIKTNFGSYNAFGGNGTTTFAVPDLRGEFLRGSGTNSRAYQGSGAAVGTHQDATMLPGMGNYENKTIYFDTLGSGFHINQTSDSSKTVSGTRYYKDVGIQTGSGSATVYSTRPTNTSVNYIIKAK